MNNTSKSIKTNRLVNKIISVILVLWLCVVAFPNFFAPTGTGLDNSWVYAVNHLFETHVNFGSDVIFPYGPLGFLIANDYNLNNQVYVNFFLVFILLLLFSTIMFYIISDNNNHIKIGFVICMYLTFSLSLRLESLLILMTGIICYISTNDKYRLYIHAVSILLALAFFIKLTIFISIFSIYILTSIIIYFKTRSVKQSLISLSMFLTALIAIAVFNNMDMVSIYKYFLYSLQYSFGYGIMMSIMGNTFILLLGISLVALFFTLLILSRKTEAVKIYIIFSISIFFAFRHGFVRQDAHVLRFFPYMLGVFATTLLAATTRRQLLYSATALLATLIITIPISLRYDEQVLEKAAGLKGLQNIGMVIDYNNSLEKMKLLSENNLITDKLPDDWINEMGTRSVDVIPSEIAYCPANNLEWNHNPLIQFANSYTAEFDMISASHFQGPDSPDFIIVEFSSVDYRHIITDVPMTWQVIMKNYKVAIEDLAHNRILLKRCPQPMEFAELEFAEDHLQFNQKYELPNRDNLLILKIKLNLNAIGIITNTIFRIPPVMMDVQYQDGSVYTCRIVPDSFRNGVILNYFPSDISELSELIKKHRTKKVVSFEIYGDGCFFFCDNAEMSFSEFVPTDSPLTCYLE